jgi:hypothetical protein
MVGRESYAEPTHIARLELRRLSAISPVPSLHPMEQSMSRGPDPGDVRTKAVRLGLVIAHAAADKYPGKLPFFFLRARMVSSIHR